MSASKALPFNLYPMNTGAPAGSNNARQQQQQQHIAAEQQPEPAPEQLDDGLSPRDDQSASGSGTDTDSGPESNDRDQEAIAAELPGHPRRRRHHRRRVVDEEEVEEEESLRKALKKPHHEDNATTVRMFITAVVTPASLAAGNTTISIDPRAAQQFLRPVLDRATGIETLKGDVTRAQFKGVTLVSERNELPFDFGLDSEIFTGGQTPKITSGNNGLTFPHIVRRESEVNYSLVGVGQGRVLFENTTMINERLFKEWGNVTIEELTAGITPIAGSDESMLDITKNKRLVDILFENQKSFKRDYPKFSYRELVRDVKKKRTQVRVFNAVLKQAIDLGIKLGYNPVREGTKDASKFSLTLRSTTSADGTFSDLRSIITKRFPGEQSGEYMDRPCAITFELEVSAKIAGTELEESNDNRKKSGAASRNTK